MLCVLLCMIRCYMNLYNMVSMYSHARDSIVLSIYMVKSQTTLTESSKEYFFNSIFFLSLRYFSILCHTTNNSHRFTYSVVHKWYYIEYVFYMCLWSFFQYFIIKLIGSKKKTFNFFFCSIDFYVVEMSE